MTKEKFDILSKLYAEAVVEVELTRMYSEELGEDYGREKHSNVKLQKALRDITELTFPGMPEHFEGWTQERFEQEQLLLIATRARNALAAAQEKDDA